MSKSSIFTYLHSLMHIRFRIPVKFLICLLCFNVFLLNSNHVLCLELDSEGICNSQLQFNHWHNDENNESGTILHSHNSRTSHAVTLYLESKAQSCPECIDQHIESIKSSPETNLFAPCLFDENKSHIIPSPKQLLYADLTPSVTRKHRPSLSSFHSSVIRSTILLI